MAYQAPITIKQALERIHRHDYVLPAIQREFVWEPDQVCRLFDSLLRGYPIGTFLFWNVRADLVEDFQFYDVMRDYHELKARHSQKLAFPQPRDLTAILDGQQRLSSLNIGLCGSYATKLPRKRVDTPDAYPPRRLHLDLLFVPAEDDDTEYRFAFLSEDDLARSNSDLEHWYPVPEILGVADQGPSIFDYVQTRGLSNNPGAFHTLSALWTAVHQNPVISFFEEEEQSLSKVLDIFVRVNSGGTVLSKSDLLLSIATAEFRERDARDAIHGLVDDLNATPPGFSFSKDLVLKAGLTLSGVSSLSFKVENFTRRNMEILDRGWDEIDRALRLAVKIVGSLGLSARTLSAASVIIPIADYVHHNGLDERWLTGRASEEDRLELRRWVIRTLVKPGIWGSSLDALLRVVHQTIRASSGRFPVAELEAGMAKMGKSLTFDVELLQDIVDTPHRNKRIVPLLTLLYPGVDTRNEFHEDHIFPKSLFTRAKLQRAGIPFEDVEAMMARFDRLPNLQLLPGSTNVQKSTTLPAAWIEARYPDPTARRGWLAMYDMTELPPDLDGFLDFYDRRRERMLDRLRGLLAPSSIVPTSLSPEPADWKSAPSALDPSPRFPGPPQYHTPSSVPFQHQVGTPQPLTEPSGPEPAVSWSDRTVVPPPPNRPDAAAGSPPWTEQPIPSQSPPRSPGQRRGTRQSPAPMEQGDLVGIDLFLTSGGMNATGGYTHDGFIVRAGSTATTEPRASFPKSNARVRDDLIRSGALQQYGPDLVFTRDVVFGSPSNAATVILGSSTNGRTAWSDEHGRTINGLLGA